MKKIAVAALFSIVFLTFSLLILAPNKAAEKTVVNDNLSNKTALEGSSFPVPTGNLNGNSSQSQEPILNELVQLNSSNYNNTLPMPSPLIVMVFIIGSVALFGLILSLCLRKWNRTEKFVFS
jgi:hypothetical protein